MLTKNHDQLTAEVARHVEADAVLQGTYWDGSRGCFIGCLAHSSDAAALEEMYGLPLPLVRICESVFEGLPAAEAAADAADAAAYAARAAADAAYAAARAADDAAAHAAYAAARAAYAADAAARAAADAAYAARLRQRDTLLRLISEA